MTDHTAALLPCPFCGGKALLTEKKHYSLVNCGSIHCEMDAGCKAQRTQDAIAAWNTRAQPQQPAGLKLVPVEPTDAMIDAGCAQHECRQHDTWYSDDPLEEGSCRKIYAAMIGAAPAHPSQQEDDVRDAKRYRWLRDKWGYIEDEYDGYDQDKMLRIYKADEDHGWDVDPESLDAAIDAAMSNSAGEA